MNSLFLSLDAGRVRVLKQPICDLSLAWEHHLSSHFGADQVVCLPSDRSQLCGGMSPRTLRVHSRGGTGVLQAHTGVYIS